jgi:hypothetical protein
MSVQMGYDRPACAPTRCHMGSHDLVEETNVRKISDPHEWTTCVIPPPMTGAVFTLQRRSEMP